MNSLFRNQITNTTVESNFRFNWPDKYVLKSLVLMLSEKDKRVLEIILHDFDEVTF